MVGFSPRLAPSTTASTIARSRASWTHFNAPVRSATLARCGRSTKSMVSSAWPDGSGASGEP